MAGLVQTANQYAVLRIGQDPRWQDVAQVSGTATDRPPTAAGDGIALLGALVAQVRIKCRRESWRRRADIGLTYHAATTYTVTVDGNAVNTAANTDAATTLRDMRDDINGDATVGQIVTAICVDSAGATVDDSTAVAVRLYGKTGSGDVWDAWTLALSVSGGSGTITGTADATSCKARVWLTEGGEAATLDGSAWEPAAVQPFSAVTYRGAVERIEVAGMNRIYVEIYDLTATGDTGVTPVAQARVGVVLLPTSIAT